jgi:hypothetical protein
MTDDSFCRRFEPCLKERYRAELSREALRCCDAQPTFQPNQAMSALGHKRTFGNVRRESGLPPKADIDRRGRHVRLVPIAT